MPVERCDYYSDEEFKQAQQSEEAAYYQRLNEDNEQAEQEYYIEQCRAELQDLVDKYDLHTVNHCMGGVTDKVPDQSTTDNPEENSDDDLPF